MAANAQQYAWVARILGVTSSGNGEPDERREQATRRWRSERAGVITTLRQLSRAIVKSQDPEAAKAYIQLQAIAKNITAEPATSRQVAELQTYLSTEHLIADAETPNPFGVVVAIRQPLLGALAQLKDTLAE